MRRPGDQSGWRGGGAALPVSGGSVQAAGLDRGRWGTSKLALGDVGWYGFGIYSLTNVHAPYVHVVFGVPNVPNPRPDLIPGPAVVFRANFYGAPHLPNVPWAEVNPVVNLNGQLMTPGFTYDFVNRGYAALTFTVDVYPELRKLLEQNPKWLEENLSELDQQELAFDFNVVAAATPMTAQDYIDYQLAQAGLMRNRILADPQAPSSLGGRRQCDGLGPGLPGVAHRSRPAAA